MIVAYKSQLIIQVGRAKARPLCQTLGHMNLSSRNNESKPSKSWAISPLGYVALVVGGLLAKFALIMWLSVVGYTLIVFGLVIILALNENKA